MEPIQKNKNIHGIFIGDGMQSGMEKPEFTIYGYIKPEDDGWVAVCVNMCLVSQGKTPTEAFEKMVKSATSYIQILKHDFPKQWKSKIEYEAPREFYDEFVDLLKELKPLLDLLSRPISKKKTAHVNIMPNLRPNIMPGNIFVQPISANYT